MAPPAILLIDSDTANWQLQNVSGQSRSRKRRALAKYKRFLKEEQLEAAVNGMAYCFIGTNKVQPTCSLFIICSGCPQTWEQRENVMNRPHWVTVWDFNGLMFPICGDTPSAPAALLQQLLQALPWEITSQSEAAVCVLLWVHLWPMTYWSVASEPSAAGALLSQMLHLLHVWKSQTFSWTWDDKLIICLKTQSNYARKPREKATLATEWIFMVYVFFFF